MERAREKPATESSKTEHRAQLLDPFLSSKEGSPSFKSLLFGRPATSEVFIERIPIEDVPEDPVQAADWLHESYRQRVSSFTKHSFVYIERPSYLLKFIGSYS